MPIKYNSADIKSVNYNGKDMDEVRYNGSLVFRKPIVYIQHSVIVFFRYVTFPNLITVDRFQFQLQSSPAPVTSSVEATIQTGFGAARQNYNATLPLGQSASAPLDRVFFSGTFDRNTFLSTMLSVSPERDNDYRYMRNLNPSNVEWRLIT